MFSNKIGVQERSGSEREQKRLPKGMPKGTQEAPKSAPGEPKTPQKLVKRAQDPPRSPQKTRKEHYPKDDGAYQCCSYRRDRQRQNTSNPRGNKKGTGGRRCSPLGEAIRRHPKGRSVSGQFSKSSFNSSNIARPRAVRQVA